MNECPHSKKISMNFLEERQTRWVCEKCGAMGFVIESDSDAAEEEISPAGWLDSSVQEATRLTVAQPL